VDRENREKTLEMGRAEKIPDKTIMKKALY
jgi:hypothetical protein